jgi:hypothetical protein
MKKEISLINETTALKAFNDPKGLDEVIAETKKLVGEFEHDLSTASGRKKTASFARKIATLKTKIDGHGKDLVADWKQKCKVIDANRKKLREELDELKDLARKPLTDWEYQEEKRKQEEFRIAEEKRLAEEVDVAHEFALLMNEKFDRDKIDAEKEAERLKVEEEERLKKEVAARAVKEKEDAVERERLAKEATKKAEAEAVRSKASAEHRARVAAENARLAEVKRQEDEAAKIKVEEKKRQDDIEHVSSVMRNAKEHLMREALVDEETAKKIILSIKHSRIPNVKIIF